MCLKFISCSYKNYNGTTILVYKNDIYKTYNKFGNFFVKCHNDTLIYSESQFFLLQNPILKVIILRGK